MKKERIALGIILILIVSSVWNILLLRKNVTEIEKTLEAIQENAEDASGDELNVTIQKAQEEWSDRATYLELFIRHDITDKIGEKISSLSAQNQDMLIEQTESILFDLENLVKREIPYIQNIL